VVRSKIAAAVANLFIFVLPEHAGLGGNARRYEMFHYGGEATV
jgi:hypothetical protein